METATTAMSLAKIKLTKPLCFSSFSSPTFFHSQNSISVSHVLPSSYLKSSPRKQQQIHLKGSNIRNEVRPLNASEAETTSEEHAERWILEPVGDGNFKHIGFRVPMPSAFEITSSVVTVGRVPEKADMVIPVGTVSGLHARIEKKDGRLLVTDLDSTNGTFINDNRLKPGLVTTVLPGNFLTFGDMNLAIFRVSKVNKGVSTKSEELEVKVEIDAPISTPAIPT
ncbi:hypothetical protein GIB67_040323 [Kingdonia uniflora]|uniref:FHA domain-containing protein n=1 Tax=Kingdonia uniflora TaxID=39325 RepID=A0A7J7L6W3_9MAGN|nr:hypothetical protein GIB67_040323 [Kingdonia uniflora]